MNFYAVLSFQKNIQLAKRTQKRRRKIQKLKEIQILIENKFWHLFIWYDRISFKARRTMIIYCAYIDFYIIWKITSPVCLRLEKNQRIISSIEISDNDGNWFSTWTLFPMCTTCRVRDLNFWVIIYRLLHPLIHHGNIYFQNVKMKDHYVICLVISRLRKKKIKKILLSSFHFNSKWLKKWSLK